MSTRGSMCAHAGCPNRVSGFTSYCPLHDHRYRRTGSATGRNLRKRDLEPYRDIVSNALDQHADNVAVVAALEMAARLLAIDVGEIGNVMRRLRDGGVTPRELLECIGAVWAHTYFQHADDGLPLTVQLAHQVYILRPLPTRAPKRIGAKRPRIRPGARALRSLGSLLRAKFGVFFSSLLRAVEKETLRERELLSAMAQPLAGF